MSAPSPARRFARLTPALLLALTWSTPAWADPKDDARRHFVAGLQYAQSGDYTTALDEFLAAQNAWPHPNTLYNIARSYADLGNLEEAVRYYRLYQAADPSRAADVDPVLAVLNARLAEQNAPPAPVEPAPTAPVAPATAGASAEDLARLAQIADELRAIQGRLATAPVPAGEAAATTATVSTSPETAPATTTPTTPTASTAPLPQPELLSDAYERIVVTASRYGQSPLDAPSTVTILTAEDIRQSGATNLPEVLRRVPGVEVMELSSGAPDLSIRGFNRELSNKVLVLVDGRSVYADFLGTVVWSTLPITPESIERIEVIRGPGSAVYGANAVTGVINIITKTPGEGESLATARAGSDGYVHGSVLADGRKERTSWRVGAGWDQVARWATSTPEGDAVQLLLDDDAWSHRGIRADARVDLGVLDKGLLSASGGYSRGQLEFYSLGALGDFAMDYTSTWARADAAYGPVHLRTFYSTLGGETGAWYEANGARSLHIDFDTYTYDAELEANGELTTGKVQHHLSGGVGYRQKGVEWGWLVGDGAPIVEHHASIFVQEEAKIAPVSIVASLRADRHPLVPIAETISPRGAVIIKAGERRSVRVTAGSAFRAPAFIESYLDLNLPAGADGIYVNDLGSTDLKPERILTGEVGFHDESTSYHTADVALYVNRVTDLIGLTDATAEVVPYDPAENGFEAATTGFANLPDLYTAMGGEAEARIFPVDGLDLYVNATVERILADDGAVDQSTSLLKVNGGAVYRTPWRIDVAAHAQYATDQTWALREYDADGKLQTQEEPVTGRPVLSARVAGRPFKDGALELAVGGWNMLGLEDGVRQHPKGQPVRGRVWGEATWRF